MADAVNTFEATLVGNQLPADASWSGGVLAAYTRHFVWASLFTFLDLVYTLRHFSLLVHFTILVIFARSERIY